MGILRCQRICRYRVLFLPARILSVAWAGILPDTAPPPTPPPALLPALYPTPLPPLPPPEACINETLLLDDMTFPCQVFCVDERKHRRRSGRSDDSNSTAQGFCACHGTPDYEMSCTGVAYRYLEAIRGTERRARGKAGSPLA